MTSPRYFLMRYCRPTALIVEGHQAVASIARLFSRLLASIINFHDSSQDTPPFCALLLLVDRKAIASEKVKFTSPVVLEPFLFILCERTVGILGLRRYVRRVGILGLRGYARRGFVVRCHPLGRSASVHGVEQRVRSLLIKSIAAMASVNQSRRCNVSGVGQTHSVRGLSL